MWFIGIGFDFLAKTYHMHIQCSRIYIGAIAPNNLHKLLPCDFLTYILKKIKQYPILQDRKSTRLNSSHVKISYAVFCLKKKKRTPNILKPYNIQLFTYFYVQDAYPIAVVRHKYTHRER